ncbi:hypothetical protein GCM10009133_28610 [Cocleimonas flava]|uniref:Uncharacterized protein DUF937 n=1 Tax=Cocleimonas flava TaxID=634765 RepID=A0A4R1F4R0_9GAMM|nr:MULTISPECIES: DUF937 domain-containing protein [Cocleimonas]MEB8431614.1 DUF937 domain-containing protein [Cocleimonas sp. KMM 6892]MEC4713614.1 DUF937 domain-containing protein [Cocleimonas sp. KMM 6895]MEC4742945.1 DUF937 domain-containing protein [Cocleimonas sp. KMM 6896]TCJ89296.1 uncharacterized protein DUF937 [Cocleimonas flava]
MNINDLLFDKNNTDAISEFANNFGVNESEAKDAISSLADSLSRGLGANTQEVKGLDSLMEALEKGNHSRYLDDPSLLGKKETTQEGNDILGHIFGDKDVSRHVAKRSSKETGLGSSLLKKMLPVVATMVMASLGKKMLGGSKTAPSRQESSGFLTNLLDADKDGSMIDDVLGMAFKAFMAR